MTDKLVNAKAEEQRERDQQERIYRRELWRYRWRVFFVFLPWGMLVIACLVTGVLALLALHEGTLPMIPTKVPMAQPRRR